MQGKVCCWLGTFAGIDAGVAIGGAVVTTAIHPVLGATFGVVHTIITIAALVFYGACFGREKLLENTCTIITGAGIAAGVITTGLAVAIFVACGLTFSIITLAVLLASFLVTSLAMGALAWAGSGKSN